MGPGRRRDPASRKGPGAASPGVPESPVPARTPREGAAAGAAGTGRRDAGACGAGLGRPPPPPAHGRGVRAAAPGKPTPLPCAPRAARYLPREQVRSESSAGSARWRRPRPADDNIPAAGTVRPAGARGRETRGERSCAATAAAPAAAADPSPPAPLLPPPAPPRRLLSRPLAAGFGSVLVRFPAPAWPEAVPGVPPGGVGRGGRSSAMTATLASAPSGRQSLLLFSPSSPLPGPHLLPSRPPPPYSVTFLSGMSRSRSVVPLLIPKVRDGGREGQEGKKNDFFLPANVPFAI